jgi:predicted aspartyl protease
VRHHPARPRLAGGHQSGRSAPAPSAAALRRRALALLGAIVLFATGCATHHHFYRLYYYNGSPWAKGAVNGVIGTFLIDTGAAATVLDEEFATRAGIRPNSTEVVLATTSEHTVRRAFANNIDFLGQKHSRTAVLIEDLSTFRAPGGIRQAGLIGSDFFSNYTLVLDLDTQSALLADEHAPIAADLVSYPLVMRDGVPALQVTFRPPDDVIEWIRLDTGNGYADETAVYIDIHGALGARILGARLGTPPDATTRVRGLAGTVDLPIYDHGPVRLLGRELPVARLSVHNHDEGAFRDGGGLLSGNMLHTFRRVEIDYPRRRICVPKVSPVVP